MGQTPPGQKQALCTAVGRQGARGLVGGEGGGGLGRDRNPGTEQEGAALPLASEQGSEGSSAVPTS